MPHVHKSSLSNSQNDYDTLAGDNADSQPRRGRLGGARGRRVCLAFLLWVWLLFLLLL